MGRDAQIALERSIARLKGDDLLAPVTVVPPHTLAGLSVRRSLAMRLGGVVNLHVLVLPRLIELIGSPDLATKGRRPLTDAFRIEAIRSVINVTREELLGDVPLDGPALRSIDASFAALDACDEGTLSRIAANSPRQRYLVERYLDFRSRVSNFYDERELVAAATEALQDGCANLRDIGGIVVFLPTAPTPQQRDFLHALAKRTRLEVVIGLSGDPEVDENALRPWPEPHERASLNGPPHANRIHQAPDAEEEIREAIRRLGERVANHQPLHRAAILYVQRDPYQRIAAEQLDAAGISWNGRLPIRYGQTVVGRTLLSFLLMADRATRTPLRLSWAEIVAPWLSGAPILDLEGKLAPAARWNQIARKANFLRDPSQWIERLAQYQSKLAKDLARLRQDADDERPWRAAAVGRDLDELRNFQGFVSELRDEIRSVPRTAKWSDYATRAERLLERHLGGRNRFSESCGTDLHADVERELEAWDTIHDLLESLIQLDELGETDPACFLAAVERGLDRPAGRVRGFGQGVFVGPLSVASGMDWGLVFVVGAAERALPAAQRDDPLLPEALRSEVGIAGVADRARRQRSEYLAALWSAEEIQLSYPRADLRGQRARLPSRWLLESASSLHDQRVYGSQIDALDASGWFHRTPSFEWAIENAVRPGAAQEYDLRSIHRAAAPHKHYLAVSEPNLRRGIELQRARRSASFGEWDGHIAGGAPGYAQRTHSPTALQDWAVCPYRYFLGRVLRVAERDEAEGVLTISPLERGALIHDILDTFFRTVASSETSFDQWSNKHQQTLASIADSKMDFAEGRGVTGRDLLWKRERELIQNDLQALLKHDNTRRDEHKLVQIESEFTFGLAGSAPVSFALSDGRKVLLRGKIDRIDESVDRTRLDVIDYKTGRADPSQSDLDQDPVMRGERLQLPVYAVAALQQRAESSLTEVSTSYWFITERGRFAKPQVTWDDKTTQRFRAVLGCIIDGIDQGLFPARPGDDGYRGPENCEHCAYDAVCSPDRQYSWNAIRPAPQLAAYVDLVEGELP